MKAGFIFFSGWMLLTADGNAGERKVNGRDSVVLESSTARVVVDLAGGAIGEFKWKDSDLNPLSWAAPRPNDSAVRGFGHFLCLDRWGPPSEAEGKRGMPYHGEASNVRWTAEPVHAPNEGIMRARLPKAGLSVRRTIRQSRSEAIFAVSEEVTNDNDLGRIFNMVQHPTLAPPFLDEATIVDCNGKRGFAQGGAMPNPEEPTTQWPRALKNGGDPVDLRHLTNDPNPNVVSFEIDGKLGWITAANAAKGMLIGYLWRTSEYPWVSVWRDVHDGKPAARGLEFGSTGLHQPFPILVKKGKIWERPLFEYLDAGEKRTKEYACFLLKIPADFGGTGDVSVEGDRLIVHEANAGRAGRQFALSTADFRLFSRDDSNER